MNSLHLLCVPAYVGEVNVDNAFVSVKTVAFRSVLSILVADVEGIATQSLYGLQEGF